MLKVQRRGPKTWCSAAEHCTRHFWCFITEGGLASLMRAFISLGSHQMPAEALKCHPQVNGRLDTCRGSSGSIFFKRLSMKRAERLLQEARMSVDRDELPWSRPIICEWDEKIEPAANFSPRRSGLFSCLWARGGQPVLLTTWNKSLVAKKNLLFQGRWGIFLHIWITPRVREAPGRGSVRRISP